MQGPKIQSVSNALTMLSDMFNRRDRVSLVLFNNDAYQITPLAPLSDEVYLMNFQHKAAQLPMQSSGGTDIKSAMGKALEVLSRRTHRNPLCHVLLFTDGQVKANL